MSATSPKEFEAPMHNKIKRSLVNLLFTKQEREMIIDAVCDYTYYPDVVLAESVGETWYEEQQEISTAIVKKVNFK